MNDSLDAPSSGAPAPRRSHSSAALLAACGACLVAFGGYLLYDRVWLAIELGKSVQRVGTIAQTEEPTWFWWSVAFDGFMASVVIALGAALLVAVGRALRRGRVEWQL